MDAVFPVSHGAYPTPCYGHYDCDPVFLKRYATRTNIETAYQDDLDHYIRASATLEAFLQKAGGDRLGPLAADPATGYAKHLERRYER